MNQRGTISLTSGIIIGLTVTSLALGSAVAIQTRRLTAERAAHSLYRGGVEALGRQAEIEAAKTNLANLKRKERTDEESKRVDARRAADDQRLRDAVAGRSVLPDPGPAAERPDRITFDRAELDRALREFIGEVSEIAIRGRSAEDKLNLAKSWALSRPPSGD